MNEPIVTTQGTVFEVKKETPLYLLCKAPTPNNRNFMDVVDDFEELAQKGLFFVSLHVGYILFEKRFYH